MSSLASDAGRARQRDPTLEQAVDAIGDLECLVDVLLDDEDRRALRLDDRDGLVHLLDDDRRQPERDLVEQQQSRVGHQRPPDRERLLLATRQPGG